MDRRRFLKLLGFGAASALVPFGIIKKPLKTRSTAAERLIAKTKAITEPSLDYKIIVVDDKGNHMWAPPIKSFTQNENPLQTIYVAEEIPIDKTCILVEAKLMDPEGFICGGHMFAAPIAACPSDRLNITYQVTA